MIEREIKQKSRRQNCYVPTGGGEFCLMWDRISELWCRHMHSKAMWPIHGKYTCPSCLREYPVAWEGTADLRQSMQQPRPRPSFLWSFKRSDTL